MAMSRIIINDWQAWGNLIKTWATGRSYFEGKDPFPKPTSLADLKSQLSQTGAGSVPGGVTDFELIDWLSNKLAIVVPPGDMVLEVEKQLKVGTPYPLPSFYNEAYGNQLTFKDAKTYLSFHAMRIGEYTINTCG